MTSITINCISTVCGAGYNVMLDPSGMSKGADSGVDIMFTNLDPNTTYTYTATLTGISDMDYTVNGTVIISGNIATSPTIISSN